MRIMPQSQQLMSGFFLFIRLLIQTIVVFWFPILMLCKFKLCCKRTLPCCCGIDLHVENIKNHIQMGITPQDLLDSD